LTIFPDAAKTFLSALSTQGLGRKNIVPNINCFCDVAVDANCMAPNVFVEGGSKPGDYVSVRAKMNALAVISNWPQLNNPCNSAAPTDIRVIVSPEPWRPLVSTLAMAD
jgi:uncharacterized protein YcgI (DUF1989 family)